MLNLLGQAVATVLTAYLTLVGGLADVVESTLSEPETESFAIADSETDLTEESLADLPSKYEYGGSLPDILIKNAAYQKASVIDSEIDNETTSTQSTYLEAIVNIFCTYRTDTYERTTTGSGFIVSDRGVILTNAHVAQFLLLEDIEEYGDTECVVRTGETATSSYRVELLYISPAWIQENAEIISQATPQGTGERDYALLYIAEGVDGQAVPARLPTIAANTDLLQTSTRGEEVVIGGYPAAQLQTEGADAILTRQIATTTVVDLFTFGTDYADIFFLTGTAIGEHGVSGGPVITKNGRAIGMISTRSNDETLGAGSLNAITLSYIHRTMLEETGYGFAANISGNLTYRAELFKATIVPFLSQMLAREI